MKRHAANYDDDFAYYSQPAILFTGLPLYATSRIIIITMIWDGTALQYVPCEKLLRDKPACNYVGLDIIVDGLTMLANFVIL